MVLMVFGSPIMGKSSSLTYLEEILQHEYWFRARQLDTAPATIEVLPEIVKAVGGRCEVYLDGGVTRGTDVVKALALGENSYHATSIEAFHATFLMIITILPITSMT